MRRAATAALAATLLLAACGGDDSGGTTTTTPRGPGTTQPVAAPTITGRTPAPDRAEFVSKADDACAEYRREIDPVNRGLTRQLRGRRRPQKLAALLNRGAAAADQAVRRIGALRIPPGDGETIAAYLETGREAARSLRGAAAAVLLGDSDGADRSMAEVRLASSRGRTIAARYGFLVCGAPNPQAG